MRVIALLIPIDRRSDVTSLLLDDAMYQAQWHRVESRCAEPLLKMCRQDNVQVPAVLDKHSHKKKKESQFT
eukprot:4757650-Amphidinium_carterae.1